LRSGADPLNRPLAFDDEFAPERVSGFVLIALGLVRNPASGSTIVLKDVNSNDAIGSPFGSTILGMPGVESTADFVNLKNVHLVEPAPVPLFNRDSKD
jgi:hypothetical protein